MEGIGVLLTFPISQYLEEELDKRFELFRYWNFPQKKEFLNRHSPSIRAVVGHGRAGADSALIDSLPELEIVASHSAGLDQIDLVRCRERGIRVTYTPGLNTDEVADLGIALMLAISRKICASDRYVRNFSWKNADFVLTSKVHFTFYTV